MTKNFRQVKKVAARPKVAHGKYVPQRVHGTSHAVNPELLAYDLKITQDISLRKLSALLGARDKLMLVAGKVPVQGLAKFNAHWYESLFIALSVDKKRKRIQIHILASQAKQLVNPKAGVKRGKRHYPHASFVTPDGLPVYKKFNLLRAEGG